jgi:hypothetical protein
MKELLKKFGLFTAAAIILLASCKGGKSNDDGLDEVSMETKGKVSKVFVAIPSPAELALLIKQTGARFDKSIMNPVENVSRYTTNAQKALNLGVYGADLSYTTTFDQTQESMVYMNACKKLSDAIGITNAINESTIQRLEANMNNKDSLLEIISDTYMETNTYLKANDRENTAALVVAGGWVEGLYISAKVAAANTNNTMLLKRIAEQKLIMDNLFELLEAYANDASIKQTMKDLEPLKAFYNKLVPVQNETESSTNDALQKTTVGASDEIIMSAEQLEEMLKIISDIRTKIIS